MKIKRIAAAVCAFIIAVSNIMFIQGAELSSLVIESFDTNSGMYTETFASGRQFMSSVPSGAMTYDAVIINIPKDINAVLTCNGKAVSYSDGDPLYTKGYYVLTLNAPDVITGENVQTVHTFRIMGTPAAGVYNATYDCPMIKCINSISSDGQLDMNRYNFPNYKAFYSTVPDYGAEVESAAFYFPVNLGYSLKRNGVGISIRNNQQVTAPGNYVLTVYAKNYGTAYGYEAVYATELNFTIPEKDTGSSFVNSAVDTVTDTISSIIGNTSSAGSLASTSTAQSRVSAPVSTPSAQEDNVVSDTLSETFNSDANMYKETFSNGDAFYTNIANNGISGGNVYIDIPSNMSVSMTKDGLAAQFANRTYINEQGTYVLTVVSNFGNSTNKARFSFRVQKGIEESNTDIEVPESEESGLPEMGEVVVQPVEGENINYYDIDNVFNEERNMFEFRVGESVFYTNMPAGMFANGGLRLDIPGELNCSVTRNGEDYDFSDEISESGDYEVYVNDREGNSITLGFSLYDRAVNNIDGFAAPKGYSITNIVYEDYKGTYVIEENEEETTEFSDDSISLSDEEQAEEEIEEESEETTEDAAKTEEIISLWETGSDIIERQVESIAQGGTPSVVFPLDGRYTIELSGEGLPSLETEIMIDKTAPVVEFTGLDENMRSEGSSVTVSCDDEDVTMTLFSKSGEERVLSESGGSVTFSGVGEYTLTAVDEAGNQSDYEFRIVRHIGAAGVGAIVLFIVIIGGVAAFVIYNSKRFSVR